VTKTFWIKFTVQDSARDIERAIAQEVDPTSYCLATKDTFATLIARHARDLGKPLRRSKKGVLRRLEAEPGSEFIAGLTPDRLIEYGRDRVKAGNGSATPAIYISFSSTLRHASSAVPEIRRPSTGST